jgi:ATP-dependent Zn protease
MPVSQPRGTALSYTRFVADIGAGTVRAVAIGPAGQIAAAMAGFSGADLANLVNEDALTAVRSGRTTLTAADFDGARDRVLLGPRHSIRWLPASSPPWPSTRPATLWSPRRR